MNSRISIHAPSPAKLLERAFASMALFVMALFAGVLFVCCIVTQPVYAHAVTSEELFAEADGLMREIDLLQTTINEEYQKYDDAMAEHQSAKDAAAEAQVRIEEEQARLTQLQTQLAACANNMYKTGGSNSLLEVVLGSVTFDEFLTKWDAINSVTNQGADLVQKSKQAKASEEEARAEYERQTAVAAEKMEEAEKSRIQIESTQAVLKEEAEKITEEATKLQEEEIERAKKEEEAAKQAEAAAEAAEKAIMGNTKLSGSKLFENPLPTGTVSSPFGFRNFRGTEMHLGLDLAAPEGTPYYAAEAGTVLFATHDGGYNGGAGNWIVITHGNGLLTKYMHSSKVLVKVGDRVERGQHIGDVGNTGDSFGAHLHFQVEYNGVAVDPTVLL